MDFTHLVTPKENDKINTIMTNLQNHLTKGMITVKAIVDSFNRNQLLDTIADELLTVTTKQWKKAR